MKGKPKVKLVGEDGNAFNILGKCIKAAQNSDIDMEAFKKEAMSGNYDNLLQTVMKYFEVV